MASKDIEIYQKIGTALINQCPTGYEQKIVLNAELGTDYVKYELDAFNKNNIVQYFTFSAAIGSDVMDNLKELRDFMVSQGQPPWTGMTFTLHSDGKFTTEFSYEPLEEDEED